MKGTEGVYMATVVKEMKGRKVVSRVPEFKVSTGDGVLRDFLGALVDNELVAVAKDLAYDFGVEGYHDEPNGRPVTVFRFYIKGEV